MTLPKRSQRHAHRVEAGPTTRFARVRTRLGTLLLVGKRDPARLVLRGLYFDEAPHAAGAIPPGALEDDAGFAEVCSQLAAYFDGSRTSFDLVLAPLGTDFQTRVWRALAGIPYGETTSYEAIALGLGMLSAVRAVGSATGRNPLSIVVPCHRVIGKDGTLTGYAGGLPSKRLLLEIEGARRSASVFAGSKVSA